MNNLTPDSKLTTETELRARVLSIRRQRERLCCPPINNRTEHHTAFQKRQQRIAKLTEREDALLRRIRGRKLTPQHS